MYFTQTPTLTSPVEARGLHLKLRLVISPREFFVRLGKIKLIRLASFLISAEFPSISTRSIFVSGVAFDKIGIEINKSLERSMSDQHSKNLFWTTPSDQITLICFYRTVHIIGYSIRTNIKLVPFGEN